MGYFPFFVDIEGKQGLIVGGGKVAAHKINKLIPFNPKLNIVAPEITEIIKKLSLSNKNIICYYKAVDVSDLENADFVIAASDDSKLNEWISRLCNERRIPVNVVDDKDKCTFIFPSLIHKGDLTIGFSTGGASPEISAAIKNETAQFIPSDIDKILDYLSSIRSLAKQQISDDEIRARFLKDTAKECMAKNGIFTTEETFNRIKSCTTSHKPTKGQVALVGAGCGGYDLITLKGLQAIRNAQVIIYDDLIDNRLLEFASESCEKIYVGKRSGKHSKKQDEINQILVDKANEGKYTVRLKGGDPFVFGRATEEIQALKAQDIEYEYIPGITSSVAIPGLAGIPVTSRNISRSFHVITGHTADNHDTIYEDMETIAKLKGTTIFLMGLKNLSVIAGELIKNGKPTDTPTAVIHGNTDNSTEIIKSTLSQIADKVQETTITSPAIIVVGEVVTLS